MFHDQDLPQSVSVGTIAQITYSVVVHLAKPNNLTCFGHMRTSHVWTCKITLSLSSRTRIAFRVANVAFKQKVWAERIQVDAMSRPRFRDLPIYHEEDKNVSLGCFTGTGRLHARVHLEKSSCKPEEEANITISIAVRQSSPGIGST